MTYPDQPVAASKTFNFAGEATGSFKNIMISVPGVRPWGKVVQQSNGSWICTMDLSTVRTGPLNCRIMAWYDDWGEKVINLDFTLLIDNPLVRRAALRVPAAAAGMKPILVDDFDAFPDERRWAFGVRPDGSQWGSGSHFMTNKENLSDVFQLPMPSCLRIRAVHDENYRDPERWNRKWRSGLLCTAYADQRPPIATFRKGYVEMKAILPLGKGMWPSMWGLPLHKDGRGPNKSFPLNELDPLEGYCQTADPGKYSISNGAIEWTSPGKMGKVSGPKFTREFDATSDWHVYACAVDDTDMTCYIDDKVTYKIPIPVPELKDPFYWMFDNALSAGDWPIVVPPAGYVDMWIDYIRIFSAD